MRNLSRLTSAANKIDAWREWIELAATAPDLAKVYQPPHSASWRVVDRQANKLRAAIANAKQSNSAR